MRGISCMPHCSGKLVAIAIKVRPQYSFFFNRIEFIFCMELLWDDGHQPHTLLLW